jgi:hypothetical protein
MTKFESVLVSYRSGWLNIDVWNFLLVVLGVRMPRKQVAQERCLNVMIPIM